VRRSLQTSTRLALALGLHVVLLSGCPSPGDTARPQATPPEASSATTSATTASAPAPIAPATVRPHDTADGWSAVVQGVRGRLVATAAPGPAGKPQLRIEIELEDMSDGASPVEIWWAGLGSMLHLSLADEAGTALPQNGVGGNDMSASPRWLKLTPHGTTRVTVSDAAYEYVPGGRTMLRPVSLQAWDMPATRTHKLYLSAKLVPPPPTEPGHRAWSGALALPPVLLP
jgi:hypothetical protein